MNDQIKIPCMFIRGGTSRGPYFLKEDLPSDVNKRDKTLLAEWVLRTLDKLMDLVVRNQLKAKLL